MRTDETQIERVLSMLKAGPACGPQFLAAYIPRYGARVWDLRRAGYMITTRTCRNPGHLHRTRQIEHVLISAPGDTTGTTRTCPCGQVLSSIAVGTVCGRCATRKVLA